MSAPKPTELCPVCNAPFEKDSERYYWHLKIHQVKEQMDKIEDIKPHGKKLHGSAQETAT